MPLLTVQLKIPTTYNNLGLPSPQPAPQTVDTGAQSEAEYIAYHASKGIGVTVLSRAAGAPTAQALFVDMTKGLGPGPAGLIPAGTNLVNTNIPGSTIPVAQLPPLVGGPDRVFPLGSPFGGSGAPAAGNGVLPAIAGLHRLTTKQIAFVAVAIIAYFSWK